MKGLNACSFIGNIGRDPEIKSTGGGTMVAKLSIGVNDREKINGEWKDAVEWVNCVAFGKTAEIIRDYTRKGSKVYVSGKLKTRSWDKDGAKQYRTEIVINDLMLLSGREEKEQGGYSRTTPAPAQTTTYASEITDEDIPF